ncbi:MAG TPA: hypothetical protein HPP90_08210 [Deltaproteobacteria bacterium]|nr:hypothetical protein [Deltaproteobacteria bacterium]
MVLTISEEEFMNMKGAVLDVDRDEAFKLIKAFVKRLEQQSRQGLKSHLDRP